MQPEREQILRACYAQTALARMGIAFERGMEIDAVRIAVEGAARAGGKVEGERMKDAA